MKQALFILFLLFSLFEENAYSQTNNLSKLTVEEAFRPKMPSHIDTLYYPFYGGIQMIEVDHIGYWDRKIFFLEQSEPRAIPHSMFNPMPIGNEYFFRDTSGSIVKAFSTKNSLSVLTKHFMKVPIRKKSNGIGFFFPHHRNQMSKEGVWYQSPQSMFDFSGHYKVSTGHAEQIAKRDDGSGLGQNKELKFGLIDSLGNVVIPIEYNAILPCKNNLLVQKENKWGIINYDNKVLVPLAYDSYEFDSDDYSGEPQEMVNVFFLTLKSTENYNPEYSYNAIFLSQDNKLIILNNYDKLPNNYAWHSIKNEGKRFISVSKNGKTGLLNEHFQEIVPPHFEIFEFNSKTQGLFRVSRAGKFGFWDKTFKEIIPLEYDYAESFQSDSTALVLKNGAFYRIDTKNKIHSTGILTPEWKKGYMSFVTDKNFIIVETSNFQGIVNTSDNSIVLPIVYNKSITPVQIKTFLEKNKALFEEKKLELLNKPDMIAELLFHQNKIIVKNFKNQFGVIDSTFKILIDFKYDSLQSIPCAINYLFYTQNGREGVMDYNERELFKEAYEEVRYDIHYEQERDIFKVRKNDKWGVINFENQIILPFEYDSIKFLGHWNRPKVKLWVVEKNNIFGVVDENNHIFIPFEYKGISHLEGNNLWVEDEKKGRYKVVIRNTN